MGFRRGSCAGAATLVLAGSPIVVIDGPFALNPGRFQHLSPDPVFSPEEANRTLPLVRRIVQDIVDTYARWQDRVREFELLAGSVTADEPDGRAGELQRSAQALAEEIAGFVGELARLGVEFKGYEEGLVDFPGEIDGRPVFLCWRLGEPDVSWYHERDAGFAGRRPLGPHLTS